MDVFDKLKILTDAAKYDAACTSSGVDKGRKNGGIGNAAACGICHSFAGDGRCISLLKVLMTNSCIYDCKYCINRRSNDTQRAAFTPRELADLTINFYKRNYIEGLFVSSGIVKSPDYTTELLIQTIKILRNEYLFNGYIHAKAIPGASPLLINELGILVDRMSVNIELPSQESLKTLAPDKSKKAILEPMGFIKNRSKENKNELVKYRSAPRFAPAGQSTQMIIGATGDTDYQILRLSEGLYQKYGLKRVFYSAYIPINEHSLLPSLDTKPPLLREHRLYQADWLLRFYNFTADELLDSEHQSFNPYLDPKCNWALNNMQMFPLEVNAADYNELLRVPGIGVKSARRIITARRTCTLNFEHLKRLGVVLKRAKYFITCNGRAEDGLKITENSMITAMMSRHALNMFNETMSITHPAEQLTFYNDNNYLEEDIRKCLTGQI